MIVTTTNTVEGKKIAEYRGLVFGEVVSGINMFRDIGAGIMNIIGGRSAGYEDELITARTSAIEEMCRRAEVLGADGVVGVDVDYEVLGSGNNMIMISASGTAVVFEK